MANIMFKRGLQANLPQTAVDGSFYLTEDTQRLYVGIGENNAPGGEKSKATEYQK